ncbi:siderophore-interacting protein [Rhodococcus sp. 3Y1]
MERPSDHLLRITARLTESTDDPTWSRPNVTVRMNLGPAFDDASRVYTVRSYDSASGSIVVDVVLHGQTSPMMRWAAALAVGDTFGLTGPRPHLIPDVPGRRIALFLDGTAIPALHSIIEQLPTDVVGIGWVTTDDEVAFAELPALPGLELHRVSADPTEPDGPLAVRARELANPASYVVWGAGERNEMRAIRKHFDRPSDSTKTTSRYSDIEGGRQQHRNRPPSTRELRAHPRRRRNPHRHRRPGHRDLIASHQPT